MQLFLIHGKNHPQLLDKAWTLRTMFRKDSTNSTFYAFFIGFLISTIVNAFIPTTSPSEQLAAAVFVGVMAIATCALAVNPLRIFLAPLAMHLLVRRPDVRGALHHAITRFLDACADSDAPSKPTFASLPDCIKYKHLLQKLNHRQALCVDLCHFSRWSAILFGGVRHWIANDSEFSASLPRSVYLTERDNPKWSRLTKALLWLAQGLPHKESISIAFPLDGHFAGSAHEQLATAASISQHQDALMASRARRAAPNTLSKGSC